MMQGLLSCECNLHQHFQVKMKPCVALHSVFRRKGAWCCGGTCWGNHEESLITLSFSFDFQMTAWPVREMSCLGVHFRRQPTPCWIVSSHSDICIAVMCLVLTHAGAMLGSFHPAGREVVETRGRKAGSYLNVSICSYGAWGPGAPPWCQRGFLGRGKFCSHSELCGDDALSTAVDRCDWADV